MSNSSAGLTLLEHTVIRAFKLLLSKFKNCEHLEYLRDFIVLCPIMTKTMQVSHKTITNYQFFAVQTNSRRLLVLTVF